MTTRLSARKAQANGDAFEQRLSRIHAGYNARGTALVLRQGPPTVPVRIGARFALQAAGKGPPDYCAIADGYTYLLDAKSSEGERWGLGGLEQHQAEHFDAATRAGQGRVICGVVLSLLRGLTVHWLPWRALGPLWWRWRVVPVANRGEGSLSEEDCGRIGRECPNGDWLPVAVACELAEGG